MIDNEAMLEILQDIDENKRQMAQETIEEYLFFRNKIEELKKLPLIQISPKNPAMQKITPAGKLIKDYSVIVDNKRKTLLSMLYKTNNNSADELLNKLAEFE